MRHPELDEDGQPLNRSYNFARRLDRAVDEVLGICRGVLADDAVVEKEAHYLHDWINVNPDLAVAWPLDALARRLEVIFRDGRVDDDEREDLTDLLIQIAGGHIGLMVGEVAATQLPLDMPPPELVFQRRTYVFTGKFALGSRSVCEDITRQLGAHCTSSVSSRTDYLVIGTFGSRDWAHSAYGRKIEQAVALRDGGAGIKIVGEDHWADAI